MTKIDAPTIQTELPEYPVEDKNELAILKFLVRDGSVSTGDASLDAVIGDGEYSEDGTVNYESYVAYHELEQRLEGEQGKLVFTVAYPVDDQDANFYRVQVGQLVEDENPVDGQHTALNTAGYAQLEFITERLEDWPVEITFNAPREEPLPMHGRDHDVRKQITIGQFDRVVETQVLTEEGLMGWVKREISDPDAQYILYAEVYHSLKQLGLEFPERDSELSYEAQRERELSALNDYQRLFSDVVKQNREFTRAIPDSFIFRLAESRDQFNKRFTDLGEKHKGMKPRLRRALHDNRSWPYIDLTDYQPLLGMPTLSQLKTLEGEVNEMSRRVDVISEQVGELELMKRYPI